MREVMAQDLDVNMAIVFYVARQVHGGHATLAEFALDQVAATEGRSEVLEILHA